MPPLISFFPRSIPSHTIYVPCLPFTPAFHSCLSFYKQFVFLHPGSLVTFRLPHSNYLLQCLCPHLHPHVYHHMHIYPLSCFCHVYVKLCVFFFYSPGPQLMRSWMAPRSPYFFPLDFLASSPLRISLLLIFSPFPSSLFSLP